MKKIAALVSSAVVFTSLFFSSETQAETQREESKVQVIYETKEEKDLQKLYEKAKKGISDIPISRAEKTNWKLDGNGELQENETTQILRIEKIGDAEITQYTTTYFADVNLADSNLDASTTTETTSEEDPTEIDYSSSYDPDNYDSAFNVPEIQPLGSGSHSTSKWDSSYGVQAYSVIYWSTITRNNIPMAKLTSARGGWNVSDTSISLSSRSVKLGTSGWPVGNQYVTYYPGSNSWSYTAPSSWGYVATNSGNTIGATSKVTLKRGTSSTWSLTLTNNR